MAVVRSRRRVPRVAAMRRSVTPRYGRVSAYVAPMPAPTLRRPLILAAVMSAMFMIAIEATIVSTAMPQIAGQLGDLHLYAWVFASFLLAQTATTVIFGKLADLFGRRPVLLVGIGIFLLGSALCGVAWSMPSLIAFRLIQGVGAGAIQPVIITVVGDIYSVEERGRIQGWLSSVWGVSSVLGPLVGGLIIQHLSWSWIFWVNLPIGLASAVLFQLYLREAPARRMRQIDITGAVLFALGITALMVAITEAGAGSPPIVLAATLAFAALAALFVWQERRAADPMLAFGLWGRRPIATTNAATLLAGMTVVGLTAFLPMYVQGVMGRSPLVAGFALTMMVLGWPLGAIVAARNFARYGLRRTLLAGAALLPFGAAVFLFLAPETSPVVAAAGSLLIGFGMGLLSNSAIVLIQDSVGWPERGAATASNIFSRNLGSTLGATALGGILNYALAHKSTPPVTLDQVRTLLDNTAAQNTPLIRAALHSALHLTFWSVFAISLVTLALALLVPTVRISKTPRQVEVMAE